ncbi:MAG: hypothetical protein PW845_04455 [Pseudomonas sp.]|uniref:hypothetical protein n=1 Tax=Pseudomonas abieticivorans TaxID=2931382 RepID=UPI0020C0C349|nr:hypothetical protein [Pseudomonas sp. PIA16]MDE1164637.1 hypothetical protein [Pseudomonas sp.]
MKKLNALHKAIALATLMSAASLSAHAEDIPLSAAVEANQLTTKVLAVDAAKHQVTLEGAQGAQIPVQLSDQAKDLGHLNVGDQVQVLVTHSVAAALDTDVDKSPPDSSAREGVVRATADNPHPGGEAYRQVRVQLKITHIDLKKHEVTFEGPAGNSKVVAVKNPKIQAKLKDLKVGQSVRVTYTDTLKITTAHQG